MRSWIPFAALLSACTAGDDTVGPSDPGATWPAADSAIDTTDTATTVLSLSGFSWVIDDELAGMPLPGQRQDLAVDLDWIAGQGVVLLVTLTEDPLDADTLAASGLDTMHVPIEDFTAPTQDQIDELVAAVDARLAAGEPVGIHCHGGLGRTGTMLASWFVWTGQTGDEAIEHVRELRPGSIETLEQEDAIREYEQRLRPD